MLFRSPTPQRLSRRDRQKGDHQSRKVRGTRGRSSSSDPLPLGLLAWAASNFFSKFSDRIGCLGQNQAERTGMAACLNPGIPSDLIDQKLNPIGRNFVSGPLVVMVMFSTPFIEWFPVCVFYPHFTAIGTFDPDGKWV